MEKENKFRDTFSYYLHTFAKCALRNDLKKKKEKTFEFSYAAETVWQTKEIFFSFFFFKDSVQGAAASSPLVGWHHPRWILFGL